MLEKIGLPTKPSLRGNNWVVDSSHCQGCATQFTFINRKHHCRRCGGLFCNSCTQYRMVLRGQGDSPVRICEPCKKLEEAARFQMRHGHKSRAGKGGSRLTSKHEDEVLYRVLGVDGKEASSSGRNVSVDTSSGSQRGTSSSSFSNIQEVATRDGEGEILRSLSVDEPIHLSCETGSASPEELRQQAMDEKKKYKVLKGEGKAEEALKAFKRGKELERQADALELLLRRNRRKALSSRNIAEIPKIKEVPTESVTKTKLSPQMGKEKDDLAAELRELGWSDVDIHDGDKKPPSMSLEGELSALLGEFSLPSITKKGTHGIDKSQVIAHKKNALMLKREGKLTEAKEELKRAKVLERQLEEQELLAEADDSDDELSALMRSMDIDKQDIFSGGSELGPSFDFNHLVGATNDFNIDDNFEVTEEDMDDPDIAAALESFGWTEESNHIDNVIHQSAPIDREALVSEIQSLKREAVSQKRAGNAAEAMQLLKKAKLLEKDIGGSVSEGNNSVVDDPIVQKGMVSQYAEKPSNKVDVSKSKLMIQKELLGLKKMALALRREGRLDEAEEQLKKGKVLEQQLEEMNNASNMKASPVNIQNDSHPDISSTLGLADEGADGDVTDQDLHDPTYLSLLKNLGWKEDHDIASFPSNASKQNDSIISGKCSNSSLTSVVSSTESRTSKRSKGEIQRELLGLKRKALVLRRQGEIDDADEMLRKAKVLEAEMAETEGSKKEILVEHYKDETIKTSSESVVDEGDAEDVTEKDMNDPALLSVLKSMGWKEEEVEPVQVSSDRDFVSQNNHSSLREEILAHKKKAVALKREGKLAEAREELRQAKLMERNLEEGDPQPSTSSCDVSISTPIVPSVGQEKQSPPNLALRPLSARDRFKLQQESLGHKRQALKLRREGRTEEAEAEFELAKALEAQLEESAAHDSMKPLPSGAKSSDDVVVEDFLDPQLLSSLKTIGLNDVGIVSRGPQNPDTVKLDVVKSENSNEERSKLEERIKAEKVKAVNLKRSGKQAEALDALRQAKLLEKKLNALASH